MSFVTNLHGAFILQLLPFDFRMAKSEGTQFFQFDSRGNMYIYAPGAGCTGEAKLVAPGDELIFSTSTHWEQHDAPCLVKLW